MVSSDNDSLYKKIVSVNDSSGELKFQATVDLTEWDTSKMSGYQQGDRVLKGYTCKIATLKPNKPKPKGRIDIDPSNQELRKAISDMYLAFDKLQTSNK